MTKSNGSPVSSKRLKIVRIVSSVGTFLLVYKTITAKSPAPVHELGKMTMNAVRIAFSKKPKNFLLPVVQHSIGFQRDERWGTTLAEWHRSACKAPRAWRELGSRITKSHGWPPVNNTQYSSSEKNVLSKERKIRRENSTNLIVKEKALINKIESETQKRINCFPTVLVTFDFASCGSLYQKSFVFTYSL